MAVWSIVTTTETINAKRFDSERYKPLYVENERFLKSIPNKKLRYYINEIAGGATPKGAKYPEKGVPFIRVQNVRQNYWELDDIVYIDEKTHHGQLRRSQIKPDDVLLTITGVSYGNSAVAYSEILPANMNQHSVRITLNGELIPEFLSTFFISKYGKFQSDSKITGDTRPALTYSEINNLIIPDIEYIEQVKIKEIIRDSFQNQQKSFSLYTQATELLEQELGLDRMEKEHSNIAAIKLSNVSATNRIDAQCYKPEYVQYIKWITDNSKFNKLGDIAISFLKGNKANIFDDGKIPYVSIKDIQDTESIPISKCKNSACIALKNDLLLAITGATIGKIGIVSRNESLAFSGDLLRIRVDENVVSPWYLLTALKSPVGQTQFNRWITGSTNGHLAPLDVRKVLVPRISPHIEKEIEKKVKQSIEKKIESESLLKQAKLKVEKLIEQTAENHEKHTG